MKSKLFLSVLVCAFSSISLAEGLPAGTYEGQGTWFDSNGRSGTASYSMTMSYNQDLTKGIYTEVGTYNVLAPTSAEGFKWEVSTTNLRPSVNNHDFKIFNSGFLVGSGTCMRNGNSGVCVEHVDSLLYSATETQEYTTDGKVHRVGTVTSKLVGFGPLPARTTFVYSIDYKLVK